MLVPKLEKSIINTKKDSDKDHLIMKVNEENYIDFRDLYLDILEDDEKEFDKYIKYIEKIIRQSFEYREYIKLLKTEFDLTKCAFFKNLDINETRKVSFEMHHYPFTLYDICQIVLLRKIEDSNEDPSNIELYDNIFKPFLIAKEVMKLHYEGKIGLVPLSITPHELYHAGNLFIPLSREYVFGNYDDFIEQYDVEKLGNYEEVLNLIRQKTKEIKEGDIELDLSKLTINKVYLQMKNTEFLKKIELEKKEEKK